MRHFHQQSIYPYAEDAIIRQFFDVSKLSTIGSHGKKSIVSFYHGGQ